MLVIIIIVSLTPAIILLIYGGLSPKIEVNNSEVKITGMFGITVKKSDIISVSMCDTLPPVKWRTCGYSFLGINKGKFKLKDGKTCFLFIQTEKPSFILIEKTDSVPLYINYKDKELTERYFAELKK